MIFRRLKRIKDVHSIRLYDDNIYISSGLIFTFIEDNSDLNTCENCFFQQRDGCIQAPCGLRRKRKDKKVGYYKLIGDLKGECVKAKDMLIDGLVRNNETLQNRIKLLCKYNVVFSANRKVYLSGPMTALIEAGKEDEAREIFEIAEANLKSFGFEVVNPFNNGVDKNEPWVKHILADLNMLDPCQAICYLHTWDLMVSPGGEMEKIVARRDKKIEIKEILRDGTYSYILL